MKKLVLALLLNFLVCIPLAHAGRAESLPSKESLLSFWEESQRQNPHTKLFKPTKEENVYQFETDFFPYKGRLKVVNAFIDKPSSEYSYDDSYKNVYTGIVEVELPDAPKDFANKYSYSYYQWRSTHTFFYNIETASWLSKEDFHALQNSHREAAYVGQSCPWYLGTLKSLLSWSPLILLGVFIIVFGKALKGRVKTQEKAQDGIIERQIQILKTAEASLAAQKEQAQTLKEILAALKK